MSFHLQHFETDRNQEGRDYIVDRETGCWVWQRALRKTGYPHNYAYRRAWEAVNGPRPEGWHIHHKCKNVACVNPDHLEAISPTEHRRIHFLEERTGLTVADLREIRRRLRDVNVNLCDLAVEYGVSHEMVYVINRGERWLGLIGESGPVQIENPRRCKSPTCGRLLEYGSGRRRDRHYCDKKCRWAYYRAKRASSEKLAP